MNNEIKIIVAAGTGMGKTTVAYEIARLLKREGYNVELQPDMDGPYSLVNLDNSTKYIKETERKISVMQTQLARPSDEHDGYLNSYQLKMQGLIP